jgi:N-methylhydantoinase A
MTQIIGSASSGPAAGVICAAQLALRAGRRDLITLDMGGTSTDVSLVVDGEPAYVSEHEIEGLPVRAVGIDRKAQPKYGTPGAAICAVSNEQLNA